MSSSSFSTPLENTEVDSIEQIGTPNCYSTMKVAFHVFLASLLAHFVPFNIVTQLPKIFHFSPQLIKATFIALIYIIISKVLGDFL